MDVATVSGSARKRGPRIQFQRYRTPQADTLAEISQAIRAAVEFSISDPLNLVGTDPYSVVARLAREAFWDTLYVERRELSELRRQATSEHPVLFEGERGTGKSTILRKFKRDLASDPANQYWYDGTTASRCVVIVDGNAISADLAVRPELEAVAKSAYQQLRSHFSEADIIASAVEPQFDAFIAEKGYGVDHFQRWARRQNPRTSDDWLRLVTTDGAELWTDAARGFDELSYAERLNAITEWMAKRCQHEVIMCVDNIDHLDGPVQERVGEAVTHLLNAMRVSVASIVALRPENSARVRRALDTGHWEVVRLVTETRGRTHHVDPISESHFAVVLSFLHARLAVARRPEVIEAIRISVEDAEVERLVSELRADTEDAELAVAPVTTSDITDYLNAVEAMIDQLVSTVFKPDTRDPDLAADNRRFARYLTRWHNGSLREIGYSVYLLVDEILRDKNIMMPIKHMLITAAERPDLELSRDRHLFNRRLLRTVMFRHLMFYGSDGFVPRTNVLVLKAEREACPPPLPPLNFLRLRILQYLNLRRRDAVHLGELYDAFDELGVSARRVVEVVSDLALPRRSDDTGLLRVECEEIRIETRDARIEVMNAGSFLVEELCFRCEFLFWSAFTTDGALKEMDLGRDSPTVGPQHLRDDNYRALVAARFVERYLMPRLREEHPFLTELGQSTPAAANAARQRLALYSQLFGFARGQWFLDRCVESINIFINQPSPNSERYAKHIESMNNVSSFCRRLDNLLD